jgi:hypothetical protein
MAYRDDLTALSARHDALASEVAEKTRELVASRRLLEQARAKAKLPVLDNIKVATPCTADWNQMTGDDRVRHCGQCQKNVYNLSGMMRDEAEALLRERNGDLCVRYYQRHDGTILLADCTVGRASRNRHRWIAAGAAGLISAGLGAAAVANQIGRDAERLSVVQGGMQELSRTTIGVAQFAPPPVELRQPPARPVVPEETRLIMGGLKPPPQELDGTPLSPEHKPRAKRPDLRQIKK